MPSIGFIQTILTGNPHRNETVANATMDRLVKSPKPKGRYNDSACYTRDLSSAVSTVLTPRMHGFSFHLSETAAKLISNHHSHTSDK